MKMPVARSAGNFKSTCAPSDRALPECALPKASETLKELAMHVVEIWTIADGEGEVLKGVEGGRLDLRDQRTKLRSSAVAAGIRTDRAKAVAAAKRSFEGVTTGGTGEGSVEVSVCVHDLILMLPDPNSTDV